MASMSLACPPLCWQAGGSAAASHLILTGQNKVTKFKTRHFARWMGKTELTDSLLCAAVVEMAQGLVDAELGGGVVKKRIGLAGRGKR